MGGVGKKFRRTIQCRAFSFIFYKSEDQDGDKSLGGIQALKNSFVELAKMLFTTVLGLVGLFSPYRQYSLCQGRAGDDLGAAAAFFSFAFIGVTEVLQADFELLL